MAEMVLTPPLRADGREPNFLQKFGHAFVHGDIFTKLSLFVWGLGYIGHGQLIKALLVTLVQGLGLYFLGTSGIPALKKFGTLGTVQMEMQFNPLTLKNEVNNYDNSFAIQHGSSDQRYNDHQCDHADRCCHAGGAEQLRFAGAEGRW